MRSIVNLCFVLALPALVLGCAAGSEGGDPGTRRDARADAPPDGGGGMDVVASDVPTDRGAGDTGLDASCAPGESLCGDRCADLASDTMNCGACGATCGPKERCAAGRCTITCDPALRVCRVGGTSACIDTQSNVAHCGECDNACAVGQVCVMGRCQCGGGQMNCGGRCVDTSGDSANCGACGNACPTGQSCVMGSCACPSGLTSCGGRCVDTSTDAANCGACGTACSGEEVCAGGACGCTGGRTSCGGRCVDTGGDASNCGGCGVVCPAGQMCNGGRCSISCSAPRTICGTGTDMTCVDTSTSTSHCGACDNACPAGRICSGGTCRCPAGQIECGGRCVDPATDSSNCGSCGMMCSGGTTCSGGACVCPPGQTLCSGRCVDTSSDLNNCGACGRTCSLANASEACIGGTCQLTSCNAGYSNCDGNPGNGCEIRHGAVINSCASPDYVGAGCGDTSCGFGCGGTSWRTIATRSGQSSRWFRVHINECSNCCGSLTSRVTLTVPAGIDYDLYVYRPCGTMIGSSRAGTGLTDSVTINQSDDCGGRDDGFDYFVEVRYFSGSSCSSWNLNIEGRDC